MAGLAHEIRDHTMESTSLEMKRLARLARALLAGAQAAEVLSSLWSHIRAKLHHDAAGSGATDGHVLIHKKGATTGYAKLSSHMVSAQHTKHQESPRHKEDLWVGHDAEDAERLLRLSTYQ